MFCRKSDIADSDLATKHLEQHWQTYLTTNLRYSCNNITMTLIQISCLFYLGFFSKTNPQMIIELTPLVSRSKSKWYKAQKVQKYALNSQLQALQILTNDDEVEN